MNESGKIRWLKHLDLLWIGIIICLVFSGLYITDAGNLLTGIANDNKVVDVSYAKLTRHMSSVSYSGENDQYEILGDDSSIGIKVSEDAQKWGFLYLDIGHMSCESLSATLKYYTGDGKAKASQKIELKEGHSVYGLKNVEFSFIKLVFNKEKGTRFSDLGVQFRENEEFFSWNRFINVFLIALGVWMCVAEILCLLIGKCRWFRQRFAGENGSLVVLNGPGVYVRSFGKKLADVFSLRQRKILRFIFLSILVIYPVIISDCEFLFAEEHTEVHIFVILAAIFLTACLCYEKDVQPVKWDARLVGCFGCLALFMTISDFVVTKDTMWTGLFVPFILFILYLAWSHMERHEQLLNEVCNVWIGLFLVGIVYCILFRKIESGYLYSGFLAGRTAFAMYMLIIVTIGAGRILERELTFISAIVSCFAAGIAGVLIWKAQELSVFLVFILLLVPAVLIAFHRATRKDSAKRILMYFLAALFAVIGASGAIMAFRYLKEPLASDTVFALDLHKKADAQNLIELVQNNNWKYFIYTKCMIWKQYIRELNLFGHSSYALYNGKETAPYNGYLLIAYRYGIAALIPYVMILAGLFKRCIEKIKGDQKGAYIALFSVAGYALLNLTQNVEIPYIGINWLWIALIAGYCMSE